VPRDFAVEREPQRAVEPAVAGAEGVVRPHRVPRRR
jgi:hypothetical protein